MLVTYQPRIGLVTVCQTAVTCMLRGQPASSPAKGEILKPRLLPDERQYDHTT
jgi:hypothetical protein